jgi:hypothetical protein
MPEQTIIVWDLETVPDIAAAARMLGMSGMADAAVREAMGDSFPEAAPTQDRLYRCSGGESPTRRLAC